jgi:hypothetical protein
MTEFNVRALIREVLDDTDYAEPDQIAKETTARIPAEHINDALHEAMRELARIVMSQHRRQVRARSTTRAEAPAGGGRSRKRDRIRRYHRELRTRYRGVSGYKLLADMTRDDLLAAAAERDDQAAANQARADELRRWAALLEQHGAARVGDLPGAALDAMFAKAA